MNKELKKAIITLVVYSVLFVINALLIKWVWVAILTDIFSVKAIGFKTSLAVTYLIWAICSKMDK